MYKGRQRWVPKAERPTSRGCGSATDGRQQWVPKAEVRTSRGCDSAGDASASRSTASSSRQGPMCNRALEHGEVERVNERVAHTDSQYSPREIVEAPLEADTVPEQWTQRGCQQTGFRHDKRHRSQQQPSWRNAGKEKQQSSFKCKDSTASASSGSRRHRSQQQPSWIASEKEEQESSFKSKGLKTGATGSGKTNLRDWDTLGEMRQAVGRSANAAILDPQLICKSEQDGEADVDVSTDEVDIKTCAADGSERGVSINLIASSVASTSEPDAGCLNDKGYKVEEMIHAELAFEGESAQTGMKDVNPSVAADSFPGAAAEQTCCFRRDCTLAEKADGNHRHASVILLTEAPACWLDSDEHVLSQWHAYTHGADANLGVALGDCGSMERTWDLGKGHLDANSVATTDACESWEDLWDCDASLEDVTSAPKETPWYNLSYLLCRRSVYSTPGSSCSSNGFCIVTQKRPRHWIDPQKPRPLPDTYFVPVRGITDENFTVAGEPFPWNMLNVSEKPCWNSHSEVMNLKWRLHCVDVRKQPRIFICGHRNSWNLHGTIGDWTQCNVNPGILDVSLAMERGQEMQVRAVQGEDGPEITHVVLTDKFALCMEHRRSECGVRCFCPEAFAEAGLSGLVAACDVQEWESVSEYMAGWRAAVELEAACSAIDDGDSRYMFNVDILWKSDGLGCIDIPVDLAVSHKMKLRASIACDEGYAEWGAGWLCLRRITENSGSWFGHGAIISASILQEDDREEVLEPEVGEEDDLLTRLAADAHLVRITFRLSVASSCAAQGVGTKRGYVVEFLPKSLPYSCMAWSLVELTWCSPLVQDAVLRGRVDSLREHYRHDVSRSHVPTGDDWFSDLQAESKDLSGWSLNMSQRIAVQNALAEPLSLIHGPPGTGKTKTASTLAALFALQNVSQGAAAVVLYCAPSNDATDVACLRVDEVATAHFKSVADIHPRQDKEDETCAICLGTGCDAVTTCKHVFHQSCLQKALTMSSRRCPVCRRALHEPGSSMHMLRVYSAEIERNDFPVPKKIDHPSARPRKARFIPERMRAHALHWRCHGAAPGVTPTAEAIVAGIAYAKLLQTSSRDPCFGEVRAQYFAALASARAAELQQADIVFATCITSRRGALAAALRVEGAPEILQVIVDEAGQSPEPETLCPLTLARVCRHVVLVGDPKQLQPIIKSSKAQSLGLNISMLERLSNLPWGRPMSLNIQYRMHPDLNAFPSAFFYDGSVRTAEAVRARPGGILQHPCDRNKERALFFWKAGSMQGEQLSQVKTADSNARSRFNTKEATSAASLALMLSKQVSSSEVAVLSWYNAQVARISALLQGSGIHVGSVVTSQGGEWDYVVLSTVRSGSGSIGCLADEHLLDVALTRARLGLCVLGAAETLRQGSTAWSAFIDHCEKQSLVITEIPKLRPFQSAAF